ncbi:MAG: NfeD family protein [Candidatus Gracilibacteria bacterium]|nr:NfeD family protein [Candidatus Gracilibacteria bacterium]
MSILYFWIAAAIIFLIIEMVTTTFYGLSLAIASAFVAGLVYFLGDTTFTILQGIVFAILSLIFAFVLPKLLSPQDPHMPQGADQYMGQVRTIKKVSGEWKVTLDGVDYLIESEDDLSAGDKVEITGHHGVTMRVKKK